MEKMRNEKRTVEYRNICVRKVDIILVKNFNDNSRDEFTARISAHAQKVEAKAGRVTRAQREKYLLQAVSVYRGDYLEDIYSEWTEELRASLRRESHQALEYLAKNCRAQGRLEHAAEYCHRLLDKDTLREDIHRELMGILLEMGDRAGAIRQFEKLRRILEEELGSDPSDETFDLLRGLLPDD
jgi:two-component SAPR family response regulator